MADQRLQSLSRLATVGGPEEQAAALREWMRVAPVLEVYVLCSRPQGCLGRRQFHAHLDQCDVCSSDVEGEDGWCDEGFAIYQRPEEWPCACGARDGKGTVKGPWPWTGPTGRLALLAYAGHEGARVLMGHCPVCVGSNPTSAGYVATCLGCGLLRAARNATGSGLADWLRGLERFPREVQEAAVRAGCREPRSHGLFATDLGVCMEESGRDRSTVQRALVAYALGET